MKRVETININGIVFSIDDDAYVKLNSYIEVLGKYFENEQGGRDIIADIEARISELFSEREGGVSRVVTIADVTKVIDTLGTPEDIAGTEETPPRPSQQTPKPMRRLYRDPDYRILGGVCAGLGAWIGIKPIIIRLILLFFVILSFRHFNFNIFHVFPSIIHGFGNGILVFIYVLLWIIIPKAKTTAQKLEMRGEPVTIDNIEKNIKESFSDPLLQKSFRNFQNEVGEVFTKIFGLIGRIIGVFLGLLLLFLGIGFATGMISMLSMQDLFFNIFNQHKIEWEFLSYTELLRHIISPTAYAILLICAITTVTLTIFALLFWGIKLMTGFKVKHKLLHVALVVVWISTIMTGIITCISQVRNFVWSSDAIVETLHIASSDTLHLAMAPSKLKVSNNSMDIYFDKDGKIFYGMPNLRIQRSDDGQTKLRLNRKSQGESKRAAFQYAEGIEYLVDVRDSLLIFDRFFTVTPHDKWKFQRLDVTLFVPEGTVIIADDALCRDRLMRSFPRRNNVCTWIMTERSGLQRN